MSASSNGNDLTALGFAELADKIDTAEVSSLEATKAHLARLDELQQTCAPMTHIYHRAATAAARASDERRARGEQRGRFDGVPLTLKESVATEGDEMTLGLSRYKSRLAPNDSVVGRLVKAAGATVLGKTNISQAMLFHESRNPLFGQTENPHDPGRTPGGSSGGEAAAIAAHGSPGGFGTDIGGSIRVPAHFCGICGLKPTVDRISNLGLGSGIPGQETIRGQIGPMGRSVEDLVALLDLISPERCAELDPRVSPLPLFRDGKKLDDIDPSSLTIGVFSTDHIVAPSAANKRAVFEAAAALESAGCRVVAFEPPITEELVFLYLAALSADGGKTLTEQLEGGPIDDALTLLLRMVRMPDPARRAASLLLSLGGERIAGRTLESIGEKTVQELWQLTKRAREMQAEVFSMWKHHGLDAVICPPHATVALPHKASRDFSIGGALAFRYNLLDFPAGSVPVTTVRAEEAERPKPSAGGRQRHDRRAAYVDMGSTGLPVGVQVAALPRREDIALRVMHLIQLGVDDAKRPPGP